jgi:hypothetical protein
VYVVESIDSDEDGDNKQIKRSKAVTSDGHHHLSLRFAPISKVTKKNCIT